MSTISHVWYKFIQASIQLSGHSSIQQTNQPSIKPSIHLSHHPMILPSIQLSSQPSFHPTIHPSIDSSNQPAIHQTIHSSVQPSFHPQMYVSYIYQCFIVFFLWRCLGQSSSMKRNGLSVLRWGENVKTALWTNSLTIPCGTSSGTWWVSFGWLDLITVCCSTNSFVIYPLH